jgi:hypothetical protein
VWKGGLSLSLSHMLYSRSAQSERHLYKLHDVRLENPPSRIYISRPYTQMYIIVRRRWLFASECTTQSTPLFDFSNCLLIMGADSFDSNYTFSINCRRRDSQRVYIKYKLRASREKKSPFHATLVDKLLTYTNDQSHCAALIS